jgi:glucose/arabinose dehydrogenase
LALALLATTLCACHDAPASSPTNGGAAPPADAPAGKLGHYDLRFEKLPPPFATADASNPPEIGPKGTSELTLPHGFTATTLVEGLSNPRRLVFAPNGDLFIVETEPGVILVLPGGQPGTPVKFADGLSLPFGLAFHDGALFVADANEILRFPYAPGDRKATAPPARIAKLPDNGFNGHVTRDLLFSADGKKMFATVGSTTNVDVETDPERASILEMNPDGTGRRTFASGTRNPLTLAWNPTTHALWAVVQERDRMGDDLAPDYLTSVTDGAFYGWPFAYLGPHEDPRRKGERPDLVAKSVAPDLLLQAHSAVIQVLFYEGAMFPADWKGDAILSFHGSWNRARRTGYKLVRVKFDHGKPVGGYDDFVVGWMKSPVEKEVWGRPAGMVVAADGSLLVCDDGANEIWRIAYRKPS